MKNFPLEGIKVIDLSRLLPGPYCTMLLSDLGAEVIKVEEPERGDYQREWEPKKGKNSGYFIGVNRNKKSITINLKSEKGREIFYRLVENADVVVESFREGVVEKLKIDFDTLSKINTRLIYLSLTGFGKNTSLSKRPAHDLNFLALSGILSFTGTRDGTPAIVGVQVADYAGAVFGVIGILAALIRRDKIKQPQYVDVAMLDCLFSFLSMVGGKFFVDGENPRSGKGLLNGGFACYNIYRTKDDRFLTVGAIEEKFWERLCELIGKPEWKSKVYIESEQEKLIQELESIFRSKSLDEWMKIFEGEDVCVEPVLNMKEAFDSDYVRDRDILSEIESEDGKVKQIRNPVRLTPEGTDIFSPHPQLGEHTEEILLSCGYTKDEILKLKEEKIV